MPAVSAMEINCDMGEGFGRWKMGPDEELMQYVDVANVACGFHAGDPSIMVKTVRLAKEHGVRVGAHPGLPDLFGFGRRRIDIEPDDMFSMILYQIGALAAILNAEGMQLNHVKPHGELYFYVQRDPAILQAVLRAVKTFEVPIYGLPTDTMIHTCEQLGVELVPEFYPDIDYDSEGRLVSVLKSSPVAPEEIGNRIGNFADQGEVTTLAGTRFNLEFASGFYSVCLHSDLPNSLDNAKYAREAANRVNGKR